MRKNSKVIQTSTFSGQVLPMTDLQKRIHFLDVKLTIKNITTAERKERRKLKKMMYSRDRREKNKQAEKITRINLSKIPESEKKILA